MEQFCGAGKPLKFKKHRLPRSEVISGEETNKEEGWMRNNISELPCTTPPTPLQALAQARRKRRVKAACDLTGRGLVAARVHKNKSVQLSVVLL